MDLDYTCIRCGTPLGVGNIEQLRIERDTFKSLVEDAVYTNLCYGTVWERHARAALAAFPQTSAQHSAPKDFGACP